MALKTTHPLPSVPVPPITLVSSAPVGSVTVEVPIGAALVGLAATLSISVQRAAPDPNVETVATKDFFTNPIFVLSPSNVSPAPSGR